MTPAEKKTEKLAEIVQYIADRECENKEQGDGAECPTVYEHEDDWCLVCAAREALADYTEGE